MEDEIVNFPVPKRLLPVVIKALAQAMEPAVTAPADSARAEVGPPQEAGLEGAAPPAAPSALDWTQLSTMKTLRKGLTLPIALKLLDLTAARPGEWIPFKEIYTAAGFTETRRAGSSLGAFTKIIKREFGVPVKSTFWPVDHHWAVNNDAQYYYSMSSEVAQAWLQSAP